MPPAETRTGDTRRDPRALLAVAALLLLLRVGVTAWEERHPPVSHDAMSWVEPQDAAAVSRATGRPVLYEFGAAWCGPCQALQQDVFDDESRARSLGSAVVPVRITDRKTEDGHNSSFVDSLQHAFAVNGFPTLVIWSPETGRHVSRTGYDRNMAQLFIWVSGGTNQVRRASSADPALLAP